MNERSYRWLRAVGIFILVVIALYGVIAINVYSSVGKFPSDEALPPAHINEIVWPTIGFPELLQQGSEMSVELDLASAATAASTVTATLTPARAELDGLSYTLGARTVVAGPSQHWPRGTAHGSGSVLLAKFALPADVVPELYDLSVEVDFGASRETDRQDNAVSVIAPHRSGDFRFISLTDVHVHERNISGFMAPVSDKGVSPDGTPVFFQRAIDQVNLIRPDFVVMMGDYVSGQRRPGEYTTEFEMLYEQLPRFQVPVFMAAGNHDQYVNGVNGAIVFEQNIGPLHYSFDVDNNHFTVVNTSQWSASDRTVMSKFFGLFNYPRKWQGQVLSAVDERKPESYRAQLAWVRDDIIAHGESAHRFMVMHHDPFRPNGKAGAWKNQRFGLVITLGGSGKGSTALKRLAWRYNVDFFITGHWHSDYVGRAGWLDRTGSTGYVNQTMVGFDEGGMQDKYPGYRLWSVEGPAVLGYTYMDGYHSMPFYDGSSLDGDTDLDALDRAALTYRRTEGGFSLGSYLGIQLDIKGLIGVFPTSPQYELSSGAAYRAVPLPKDPSRTLLYVQALVGPGVPGADATTVGDQAVTDIVVR